MTAIYQAQYNEFPGIVDMDIWHDADDPFVAGLIFQNSDIMNIKLIITNDEAESKGRVRFLSGLRSCFGSTIDIAAGRPSSKKRKTALVERYRDVFGFPFRDDYIASGIDRLVDVISQYPRVNYFGLGALTNLAEVLRRYPEFRNRINLIQMGLVFGRNGRTRPQYNVGLDIDAFRFVLQNLEYPRFLMTHTSWGQYGADSSSRQQIGIYPDDPVCRRLLSCEHTGLRILGQYILAWHQDGKPCSIMHDPLTFLSFYQPDMVDYVEGDIIFGNDGATSIVKTTMADLGRFPQGRIEKIEEVLRNGNAAEEGLQKRIVFSLSPDYQLFREEFIRLLFKGREPDLAGEWERYNSSQPVSEQCFQDMVRNG